MEIITEEIKLRAIELADINLLKNLVNSPEVETKLGGWSFPVSDLQQENWIRNLNNEKTCLRLIIEVNETALGTIILSDIDMKNGNAQIHIKMIDGKGKGYGSKAIKSLCRYAFFELRLNLIYAHVNAENLHSRNTFRKCHFLEEAVLRKRVYKNGEYHDVLSFVLEKEQING